MKQIADWLKTLGMSEYAERFAESDIDTLAVFGSAEREISRG
jgi:hypothetical protein